MKAMWRFRTKQNGVRRSEMVPKENLDRGLGDMFIAVDGLSDALTFPRGACQCYDLAQLPVRLLMNMLGHAYNSFLVHAFLQTAKI